MKMMLIFLILRAAQSSLDILSLPLDEFREKYSPSQHDNALLLRTINERLSYYKQLAQSLKPRIEHTRTTPVVKWAQSNQQILLQIKLSHRQDSPTCSDTNKEKVIFIGVTEVSSEVEYGSEEGTDSAVDFSSQCYFTTQNLIFEIHLQFQAALTKVTFKRSGLGTYRLVGDKAVEGIWITPFTDSDKAAIWIQMRDKFQEPMNKYFDMKFAAQQNNIKKKRRRRKSNNNRQQVKQSTIEQQKQSQNETLLSNQQL